jgi:uncharacterized protein (UPF0261 family)
LAGEGVLNEIPCRDILLIATLDTKTEVAFYLKEQIEERGKSVLLLDCSMGKSKGGLVPDISSEEIARRGGRPYGEVISSDQFEAGRVMTEGVKRTVADLFAEKRFKAVLGVGGSNGTLIATAGMRELPVGVPKVVISAMACGTAQFGPYVGTKDIIVIPSVADILGVNPISRVIFDNAVGALVGMLDQEGKNSSPDQEQIALSMLGQTTPAGMAGREVLEREGYRVVAFHPNGVGGAAMEEFIGRGAFSGVWELTPHEVADELLSRIHSAGPDRMKEAGLRGIPQVVVPGCVDFFYGTPGTPHGLADRYRDRQTYMINPEIILVKIIPEEACRVARALAEKMNQSRGSVTLVIPRKGISRYDRPEFPFCNPDLDSVLFEHLKKFLRPGIPVLEVDAHISDHRFGETCASVLLDLLKVRKKANQ